MSAYAKNPKIQTYKSRLAGTEIERVRKYSPVGGYPIFYVTRDGGVLSAKAVEENLEACCDPEQPDWFVVAHDANWEDPDLHCDHTGERIESAYAEEESA